MGSWRTFFAVVVLVGWGILPGAAQIDRATLNGTVTDASGGVVPGAKVEALSNDTGKQREVLTNDNGIYVIPALPVGSYNVTFSRQGFKTARYKEVSLRVGETTTLDAQLEVGEVATQIEVKGGVVRLLDRASPSVAGFVQNEQIANLPVNGRNWATLLIYAPGAIDDGGGDQRTIRFAGRGRDDNNYTIDGVDATGIQEQAVKSATRLQLSEDAIAEYRVNSMLYSAEYGAGAGGQVDVATKSGTNLYHGEIFEYFRNSALDSRAFIDPPQIPPFRLNHYGGQFGGPIKRDKTFFFFNFEGLRQAQGGTLIGFVPSAAFKAQVHATSPQLDPLMAAYPAGNGSTSDPSTDQLTHQGHGFTREDSVTVRLDQTFTDRTSVTFRMTRDVAFNQAPLGSLLDTQGINNNPSNWALALQHTFSPTTFNEVKFGINRAPYHNPQTAAFPVTSGPYIFDVSTAAFSELNNDLTDNEVGTTFGYIDNLTLIRGRHTFKTGGELRRIWLNQGITDDPRLTFTDSTSLINDSLANFKIRTSWWSRGYRRFLVMPYFQDEWKVRPNFTVDMGLRWEYYSVMKEVKDRLTIFDLTDCKGICLPGSPTEFPYHRNFDPRFGLTWSPRRFSDKTVIRTGFGIYSGAGQNDDTNAAFESNDFRVSLTSADFPNLSFPITPAELAQASVAGRTPRALDRHRRDLYVEEWGLSVQQALPQDFVFQMGYMGSAGVRLFSRSFVNVCTGPVNLSTGACPRPLPGFGIIDIKKTVGNSSFNALQVSLQRHFTKGWLWGTQYLWSHSINDGSVGGGEANAPENVACRRCDRGSSIFDVAHNFVADSVYELPFGPGRRYWKASGVLGKLLEGWNASGTGVAHTGHPLTVVISRDPTVIPDGNDNSAQRPDRVAGVPVIPPGQNADNWINFNAFAVPAAGTFGNAGRSLIRAPSVWSVDFGLQKHSRINERFGLDFLVEAYNIFNHKQLGDPATLDLAAGPGAPFGVINTTVSFNNNNDNFAPVGVGSGLPRQIEFGLKLIF